MELSETGVKKAAAVKKCFRVTWFVGSVSCQPGRVTVCRFGKEVTGKGICVQLPCRNVGFLALTDICDEYPEKPFEQILEGSFAR